MTQEEIRRSKKVPNATMSFWSHFDELRERLMRCLWVFFGGFIAAYFVADFFLAILRKPLFEVLPLEQQKLYFTSLFENFLTHLKVSGYAAVFFLSPYFFYEVWKFISPGLLEREKKMVVPFVSAASLFFIGGACFAYYVLFPVGFRYFVNYGGPSEVPMLTIDSYYTTCLKLLFLFGLAFESPVMVVLLGYLGVVDEIGLRAHRRTAFLIITVASALFAPPDAISMLILMAPLALMYEGAILVVAWISRRRALDPEFARRKAEREASRVAENQEPSSFWIGKSR